VVEVEDRDLEVVVVTEEIGGNALYSKKFLSSLLSILLLLLLLSTIQTPINNNISILQPFNPFNPFNNLKKISQKKNKKQKIFFLFLQVSPTSLTLLQQTKYYGRKKGEIESWKKTKQNKTKQKTKNKKQKQNKTKNKTKIDETQSFWAASHKQHQFFLNQQYQ